MSKYSILDCTLRDGGYINDFDFGYFTIKEIISKLNESKVDIIECGFLKSNAFDKDKTLFGSVEAIRNLIEPKNNYTLYVAMIAYGDISSDEIEICDGTSIDGIRVTFHKNQIDDAFELGKELIEKKYKVFMQPVGTTSYSEDDLCKLVDKVNEIEPYAFYLVDTLGTMYKRDLLDMVNIVNQKLNVNIKLGFHSHNNLQLSFSNAIELLSLESDRDFIIDSSVFGMGRGSGNLCTELITKYINQNIENKYDVVPILEIYDEHINRILLRYKWGYSLPYFIASMNNCHPNYATHLVNKQTITIKEINSILSSMTKEKRDMFDKEYIENLYIEFQNHNVDDTESLVTLKSSLYNENIVILAPGKSVAEESEKIIDYCKKNNSKIIAVNFIPEICKIDYLFLSNQKRIKNLSNISKEYEVVITSNLISEKVDNYHIVNYSNYLNEDAIISDNAGLMLLNLLCKLGINKVTLAGFDGFGNYQIENYYKSEYTNSTECESLIEKTNAIKRKLNDISRKIEIEFLTKTRYTTNE